jgi:hypothetical protein
MSNMFGKKKDKQAQVKLPTPREILMDKITKEVEVLTQGQAVIYQLPEFYVFARFLGVEANPTFPQKGKKYCMFTYGQMAGGKPAGQKSIINKTNNARDYADWVADRDNDQYGHVKRFQ